MTKKIRVTPHLYYLLLILPIVAIHGRFSTKAWRKTAHTSNRSASSSSDGDTTISDVTTTEHPFAEPFTLDVETESTSHAEDESTTSAETTIPTPSTDGTVVRFHGPDDFFHPLPNTTHNATVFFLHGLGNYGSWMKQWITIVQEKNISLPHIKVIFPTAPASASKYFFGQVRNIWFDREDKTANETEDWASMLRAIAGLADLIVQEVKSSGIPHNKMIIGGYASGGAMALHMAYRFFPEMAGVFGINTFLPSNSTVFQEVRQRQNTTKHLPKAYFSVGDGQTKYKESVMAWSKETMRELCQLGVDGEFAIIGKSEILGKLQLEDLWRWIQETLA